MAKPLGYYCNVTSGNILDELQDKYGSTCEKLGRKQKLYLLVCVASSLSDELQELGDDLTNPEITEIIDRLQRELTPNDKENLLIAFAHQIREQRETPKQ